MENVMNPHIENRLKAPAKFFEWAKKQFPIYVWSNKRQTIVSSERTAFSEKKEKRLTTKSRLTFYSGTHHFLWVGGTSKRIEFQMYEISQHIEEGKESFKVRLKNFDKYSNGERIQLTRKYSFSDSSMAYSPGLSPLREGCFYQYSGPYEYYYAYQSDEEIFELMKKTEMKYLDFEEFKALVGNGSRYFDFCRQFAHIYKYRYLIEHIQKIRAVGLLKEVVGYMYSYVYKATHQHADMRCVTFNFVKRNKALFRKSNLTYTEYLLRRQIVEKFGVCVPGFEHLFRDAEYWDLKPDYVKSRKFQNWVVKHQVEGHYYRDYRSMIEKLGITFFSNRIVMPDNIRAAHDEAVRNFNALKKEKEARVYQERLEELLKAETAIGEYLFIVPRKLSELRDEGRALSHCVGSYSDRMRRGETTIFFVRKKSNPDVSLYTLEVKNGSVAQIQGYKNKVVIPEEVKQYTNQFVEHVRKLKIAV